jgi:hypothetical protein
VAFCEVTVTGLIILISAQPLPAVSVLTVSPVTALRPAPVKLTVWTGPGFPDEYTHWYFSVPRVVAVSMPL